MFLKQSFLLAHVCMEIPDNKAKNMVNFCCFHVLLFLQTAGLFLFGVFLSL